MKKQSKYIQFIIFLSAAALIGFTVIQFYWLKTSFQEKKSNLKNTVGLCADEVGHEIIDYVLNKKQLDSKNLNIDKKPSKFPYFGEMNSKVNQPEIKMNSDHEINKQNNESKSISGAKIFNNELRSMPEVNKASNETGDFKLDNLTVILDNNNLQQISV